MHSVAKSLSCGPRREASMAEHYELFFFAAFAPKSASLRPRPSRIKLQKTSPSPNVGCTRAGASYQQSPEGCHKCFNFSRKFKGGFMLPRKPYLYVVIALVLGLLGGHSVYAVDN